MMPGPPRITLDQESFKALASEVRVEVLKRLDERRATVTDLSNLMGLSKPTLLEHLEKLQAAGLVKRIDEGRKWIYYELSDKGRKILHPEKVAIVLALSSAVGLAAIGLFFVLAGTTALLGARTPESQVAGPQDVFFGPAVGGVPWAAVLAFAAAGVAVLAGFLLRRWGRRRREELFETLVQRTSSSP